MSKGVSVKIATAKVIKSLEAALVKLEKNYIEQGINEEKYRVATEKWNKDIFKKALALVDKAKETRVSTHYSGAYIDVSFELPISTLDMTKEPQREYDQIAQWQYKENKEELESTIRILKLTDDEFVSTSTYKNISKWL